jgi:antitoxin PrlF
MESTVTSKGQATIPKELRDRLNLKPGDHVKWFLHPNGHIVLYPTVDISVLRSCLKSYVNGPTTIDDINDAIAAGAVERYDRYLNQG